MLDRKRSVGKTYGRKKARLSSASAEQSVVNATRRVSSPSTSDDDEAVSLALLPDSPSPHRIRNPRRSHIKPNERDTPEWDEQAAAASSNSAAFISSSTKGKGPTRVTKTRTEPPDVLEHQRPVTPPAATSPAARTSPKQLQPAAAAATATSPAKDLSSVFQRYLHAHQDVTDTESNSEVAPRPVDDRHPQPTKRVVNALASRKNAKSPNALKKSHSHPFASSDVSPSKSIASLSEALSSPSRAGSETPDQAFLASPSRQRSTLSSARPATNGLKRTYGGSRTIKADESQNNLLEPVVGSSSDLLATRNAIGSTATHKPPRVTREAYSALREKWGADEEEAMADGELKSVVQMKARGETARLTDESAYLLEGLEADHPIGLKRTSAIEVVKKLSKDDFRRRVKASGIVEDVYGAFRKAGAGHGDKVLDCCLAVLLCLLCADQRVVEPLMRIRASSFAEPGSSDDRSPQDGDNDSCDVLIVLKTMSSQSWSDSFLSAAKAPKNELRLLKDLSQVVQEVGMLSSLHVPITLQNLCLLSISGISGFTPRSIFRPHQSICSSGVLDHVSGLLVETSKVLDERVSRFERGLDLIPADGTLSLRTIDVQLRIIEACLETSETALSMLSGRIQDLSAALAKVLMACELVLLPKQPFSTTGNELVASAQDCAISVLQIVIDLTTTSPAWSACLADSSIVPLLVRMVTFARRLDTASTPFGDDDRAFASHSFDCLCLALGALTNLAESVDSTRSQIQSEVLSADCPQSRTCARKCQCENSDSMLNRLIKLYTHDLASEWTEGELNTSFVSGYSAILLGLLMIDSDANRHAVMTALNQSSRKQGKASVDKLEALLEALTEFADLHDHQNQNEGTVAALGKTRGQVQRVHHGDRQEEEDTIAAKLRQLVAKLKD